MRSTLRPTTLVIALALAVPGAASALQVDVLWWDGADQFDADGPVFIRPFAAGDKLGGGSTVAGTQTWDLQITGYSRTWDVTAASVGELKQADLFLSFTVDGISSYTVSTRFDGPPAVPTC